jgi:hypothetical protein
MQSTSRLTYGGLTQGESMRDQQLEHRLRAVILKELNALEAQPCESTGAKP